MAEDATLFAAIGGLVVAILSLVVSIGSFVNAQHAKQLARQGALLGKRTEAIDHVRKALSYLIRKEEIAHARRSVVEAKALADVVFSKTVRADFDRVRKILGEYNAALGSLLDQGQDSTAMGALGKMTRATLIEHLRNLLEQMKQEAAP